MMNTAKSVLLALTAAVLMIVLPVAAHASGGPPSAAGTWVGVWTHDGIDRPVVLELAERDGRQLLGYVLGGTESQTIVEGMRRGRRLRLTIEIRDPVETVALTVSGRLRGDRIVATVDDGRSVGRLNLRRTDHMLHEQRFVLAAPVPVGTPSILSVAAVFDDAGNLVSGAYVGRRNCLPWGCAGWVTSLSATGSTLSVELGTGGACPGAATVSMTFDAGSKLYAGTYSAIDCDGTRTGSMIGGRSTSTRSDDVAGVLAALGRLADDFADRRMFGAMHPSFAPGYLHYGQTLGDVLAEFNDERAAHGRVAAAFNRIRSVNTVPDADVSPLLQQALGATFDQQRRAASGADFYVDTHAEPGDNPLGAWRKIGRRWVISGNQIAALSLPFEYSVGTSSLLASTPGGPIDVSVGPYGAHFSPLTGHPQGDAKGNLMGFFTRTRAELTEIAGNGNGVCDTGERCAVYGGSDGALLRSRVPAYRSPLAATLNSLTYTPPNGLYLDNAPKWQLELQLYLGHALRLDHVGRIASGLRDRILAATGIDTDTYVGPPGDLPGVSGLTVAAGEVVAFPQVIATEVSGHPGYFAGDPEGLGVATPVVQMEFALIGPALIDRVCYYAHLPATVQHALQSVLDADMADPRSQRFEPTPRRWEWSAEARLCNAYSPQPQDFSAFYTDLGGWFEDDAGVAGDELLGFVPIATATASYDHSLYEPSTRMLVNRLRTFGTPFTWTLPGLGAVDVFYPSGEIVESGASSLLIKWRTTGLVDIEVYQRAAYLRGRHGLKVAWGAFADTAAGAVEPALDATTPCDGTSVVCYSHQFPSGS